MTNAEAYKLYTSGKITYGKYKDVLDSNVPSVSMTNPDSAMAAAREIVRESHN